MAVVVNITTKTHLGKVAKAVAGAGIVAIVVAGFQAITLVQTTGASASAQDKILLGAMTIMMMTNTMAIN